MNLSNKTALVTGAGRGIGKGCALALADCGANLIINDRPESSDLQETCDEILVRGHSCTSIAANTFVHDECQTLVQTALESVERIDILVSNPAKNIRSPYATYDVADFETTLHGTLTSSFYISQLVAQHMIERGGGGKIVFISSIHAEIPYANNAAYNAAKAGLNHMTRTIATELAEHRINVNVIEPGWIDTPGNRRTLDDEAVEQISADIPWGRVGLPSDIGKAAAFLCSEEADYVTGAALRVDGGISWKDCRSKAVQE